MQTLKAPEPLTMKPAPPQETSQTAPPEHSSALETTLTPAQVSRLGKWGKTRRKGLQAAWRGRCSPRDAIKMQCLDCCGEDEGAIAGCGARCCPLWQFRPFQHRQN
jgi:hypothetical protein